MKDKYLFFPFKTMEIMASFFFFYSFDEILSLSFDLWKWTPMALDMSQFCKGLSKGLI